MCVTQPLDELLELAKATAARAGARLLEFTDAHRAYSHTSGNAREIKAVADTVLDREILRELAATGLPVLSEESGLNGGTGASQYRFIVDPLDGTFNFVKGLGPSAVCIALWESELPLFGVIYSLSDRALSWGGGGFGAYTDGKPIHVSDTTRIEHAALCTGFPARFDFSADALQRFATSLAPYAKIRMIGSAAVSLLHVARGAADAYAEDNIMLWDVAAGLALVEGAGGRIAIRPTGEKWCYRTAASNGWLALEPRA